MDTPLKPKVALNPEFAALIDEAVKKAVKESIPEPPKRSTRLLEGVAIGVLVTGLSWATSTYFTTNEAHMSFDDTFDLKENFDEKVAYFKPDPFS